MNTNELNPAPENSAAWKFYAQFYRNKRRRLLIITIISILQPLVIAPIILFVQRSFDKFIPQSDITTLVVSGIGVTVLYSLNSAIVVWSRYQILDMVKKAIERVRVELLSKFYVFPLSFYNKTQKSKLHTIMVQDTERLDVATNALLVYFIPALTRALAL